MSEIGVKATIEGFGDIDPDDPESVRAALDFMADNTMKSIRDDADPREVLWLVYRGLHAWLLTAGTTLYEACRLGAPGIGMDTSIALYDMISEHLVNEGPFQRPEKITFEELVSHAINNANQVDIEDQIATQRDDDSPAGDYVPAANDQLEAGDAA